MRDCTRLVLLIALLALVACARPGFAEPSGVTIIRAANAFDGRSEVLSGPVEILVRNGRIVSMGKQVEHPSGAVVVDLPGHTVMPGFIDCHVHLTMRPQTQAQLWGMSGADKALLGVEALRILLDHGFTTVRDLGDTDVQGYTTVSLRRAVDRGLITGPRVISAAHALSTRGGHGDFSTLVSTETATSQAGLADGVDEIRRVVRTEISRGAQWIKFMATGGFSSPSDEPSMVPYSQEEINVLVQTARGMNTPVAPHAYGDEGIRRAVNAGVRSIEHGNLASLETLRLMEAKGVFLVPTLCAVVRQARMADDDAFWEKAGRAPYVRAKYRKYAKAILDSVRNLAASNVKVALGTDIGTFSYERNGAVEFGEMVACGLSPIRALRAGSSVAAELLMLDDVGVLAPGKVADIVAVLGNPLEDIRVTEKVDFVMKGGVVHKRPR